MIAGGNISGIGIPDFANYWHHTNTYLLEELAAFLALVVLVNSAKYLVAVIADNYLWSLRFFSFLLVWTQRWRTNSSYNCMKSSRGIMVSWLFSR
ncbi:MAG: hypothetical protein PHI65_08315 [Firmicutes bacterium]|nr:hypothetical protein [Bacillota bacterium]